MTTQQRILLLQSMPFFGAIKTSSVNLILELSKTLSIKSGDYFFHQGDLGDSLFVLEKGQASIFKTYDDKEYVLRTALDGDCFGDLALIDFTPRSASVRAEADCKALKIPSSTLHTLYKQDSEQFLLIQMNIAREVSRRLRKADDRWFQCQITDNDNAQQKE
ncbi:MAG: CRP-like cAMP-binding protein [Oceanicoccus sp.]|jgi:CRP-like cAMP-binding protein